MSIPLVTRTSYQNNTIADAGVANTNEDQLLAALNQVIQLLNADPCPLNVDSVDSYHASQTGAASSLVATDANGGVTVSGTVAKTGYGTALEAITGNGKGRLRNFFDPSGPDIWALSLGFNRTNTTTGTADGSSHNCVEIMLLGVDGPAGSGGIVFGAGVNYPTERMRLTALGRLLLGVAVDDGVNQLQVSGGISVDGITRMSTESFGPFNDNSAHVLGVIFNHQCTLMITDSGGTAYIPMWANGGQGVGWTVTLITSVGLTVNCQSSVDHTIVGGNTYRIGVNGGPITITRIAGSAPFTPIMLNS